MRAKRLPSAAFLEHAERLVRAAEPYRASVIINDRVDVALLAGAAGAHVGQEDLPPAVMVEKPSPAVVAEQDCPCGSGKPFSKCHGAPEEDEVSATA